MIWAVIKLSRESLLPSNYELKEYWTWKPMGKKPRIFRWFSKTRYWGGERERKEGAAFSLGGDGNDPSMRAASPAKSTIDEYSQQEHEPEPRPFRELIL